MLFKLMQRTLKIFVTFFCTTIRYITTKAGERKIYQRNCGFVPLPQ